jgi:RimJ/RimL family protein N-acetyltransferase
MYGSGLPQRPRPVRLETERFLLRSLLARDASERYLAWAADSEVMGPLNVKPVKMSTAQLTAYITGFDNISRFIVGIFVRNDKRHIGFYVIDVDMPHEVASFNVVIGDKEYWGQKVVMETRPALLDEFLIERGVEKIIGLPLARNFPAIFNYKAEGWTLEGTFKSHRKSVFDGKRLDQMQFSMLRDEWRMRRMPA